MEKMYNTLKHYGKIIADKTHETTEKHSIRFTTYLFEDRYYVVTMFDSVVIVVAEKDDISEMLKIKGIKENKTTDWNSTWNL